MEKKNLVLCGVFLIVMFVLLIGGTALIGTGTMFGFVMGLGLASMFASMYFWYQFASPIYDAAMN